MTDDPADGYFGESVAARYDETAANLFEPAVLEPAVDFLAERAGSGRALELGIGTGRVALPLAARGIPVHGIELSRAMVARLRAKPGGDAIGITIGDFATAEAEGTFTLAYLPRNTIMNLTTQAAQVACFHFRAIDGSIHLQSIPFRDVWPAELDLMAEVAGLVLSERWSGWEGQPFTNESREHVSVWEKPRS